jgi:hypothetical protein
MGWEARGKRGVVYFYRCRRVAGKAVKEYCGRGPRATAAAEALARAQARRAADQHGVEQQVVDLAEPDRLTRELAQAAQLLLEAALLASGHHRHNYGPWRKRRGCTSN